MTIEEVREKVEQKAAELRAEAQSPIQRYHHQEYKLEELAKRYDEVAEWLEEAEEAETEAYYRGVKTANRRISPAIREIHDGVYLQGLKTGVEEYKKLLHEGLTNEVTAVVDVIALIDETAESYVQTAEKEHLSLKTQR